jgi:hypothetical protein
MFWEGIFLNSVMLSMCTMFLYSYLDWLFCFPNVCEATLTRNLINALGEEGSCGSLMDLSILVSVLADLMTGFLSLIFWEFFWRWFG